MDMQQRLNFRPLPHGQGWLRPGWAAAGFGAGTDEARGLDHGAWVPLMLMYPSADIPVVQLSIQSRLGPEHHLRLGRAVAALRNEDVLVIGTGSYTHNLSTMARGQLAAAEPQWCREFSDWIHGGLIEGRISDLLAYRRLAPHAVQAHPTETISYRFSPAWVRAAKGPQPNAYIRAPPSAA